MNAKAKIDMNLGKFVLLKDKLQAQIIPKHIYQNNQYKNLTLLIENVII